MTSKLLKLTIFELKKNLLHSSNWLNGIVFLLINIAIFPFSIDPEQQIFSQFMLPVIMTSILLGITLVTHHVFDEDLQDGSLNQYRVFGVPMHILYLSKLLAISVEFSIILTVIFPCVGLLYNIDFLIIMKIWLVVVMVIPLLSGISVFGNILTINLGNNAILSILLVFPLMISALICLSLAAGQILAANNFFDYLPYIEMNFGLTLITIPSLCWLANRV